MKAFQILSKADIDRRRRAAMLYPVFKSFDSKTGTFEFEVIGKTGVYTCKIQIHPNQWKLKSTKELFQELGTRRRRLKKEKWLSHEKLYEALKDNSRRLDILVYCSCPDFLYRGFAYIAHKLGFGIKRETRPPRKRNPRLKGSVCYHLCAVLEDIQ